VKKVIFKQIPDAPGYFAGSDGNIYSNCPRGISKITTKLRKLKPSIQSTGRYYVLVVKKDNVRKTHRVHRLICETYHGCAPDKKSTVSHLDGNWKNNKPENLKWESYSDNHQRKKDHGTDDVGIKNSRALINLETLKKIRYYLSIGNLTQKEIGEKFGLSRLFITKIANGHRYKGQGY
jgi:hypothetical protein